mgnify:CR=1 FL=1
MRVIEQLMAEQGRRWVWLAKRMGVTRNRLSYTVHRQVRPPYADVRAIAFALGVQPDELVDVAGHWREAVETAPIA